MASPPPQEAADQAAVQQADVSAFVYQYIFNVSGPDAPG